MASLAIRSPHSSNRHDAGCRGAGGDRVGGEVVGIVSPPPLYCVVIFLFSVEWVAPHPMNTYEQLATALLQDGIRCQFQAPEQLVVSAQVGEVWPDCGNSFWVTHV